MLRVIQTSYSYCVIICSTLSRTQWDKSVWSFNSGQAIAFGVYTYLSQTSIESVQWWLNLQPWHAQISHLLNLRQALLTLTVNDLPICDIREPTKTSEWRFSPTCGNKVIIVGSSFAVNQHTPLLLDWVRQMVSTTALCGQHLSCPQSLHVSVQCTAIMLYLKEEARDSNKYNDYFGLNKILCNLDA